MDVWCWLCAVALLSAIVLGPCLFLFVFSWEFEVGSWCYREAGRLVLQPSEPVGLLLIGGEEPAQGTGLSRSSPTMCLIRVSGHEAPQDESQYNRSGGLNTARGKKPRREAHKRQESGLKLPVCTRICRQGGEFARRQNKFEWLEGPFPPDPFLRGIRRSVHGMDRGLLGKGAANVSTLRGTGVPAGEAETGGDRRRHRGSSACSLHGIQDKSVGPWV